MLGSRPPTVAPKTPDAAPPLPAQTPEADRPDALAADVARAVRELRAQAGLSERAAARLLGTSQTQLRRMEDPRYLPALRSVARVAAAYGHRVRISFEPKDKPAAKPPQRAPARPKPAPARVKRGGGKGAKGGRARRRP
ncbi:MAG: helix-turn-helix transcriptional regulator [Chloroflexota bacterium]|nr:helix-turn-helix transcriptional regulator [Chloroflexota bacterium]MDE3193376.1 helix-turn-helix transcriptional regulator [Chloroflexota bacterium]